MLNKIKDIYFQIKTISNTDKYRIIILMLIAVSILNSFNVASGLSFESAFIYYTSTALFLFFVIGSLFLSSLLVISLIDKNYSYILRFKSKKEYMTNLLILVTFMNLLTFIMAIIFGLIILTFKFYGNIRLTYFTNYNIPYLIYNIFVIIKYFFVINVLSLIGVCTYKGIGKVWSYLFYVVVLILYYGLPLPIDIITEFNFNNLLFCYYLVPLQYSNFLSEIVFFVIELCFLSIVLGISLIYTIKFNKIKIDE